MKKIPLLAKIMIPVLILIILLSVFLFGRPLYEQSKMKPLETGEVVSNVYAINNGFVNCYLVKGDSGYIMIDAGKDQEQTLKALQELGISPEEVIAILLTHSDGDHVAALSRFSKAKIYLPEWEVQMIDGTTKRNILGSNNLDSDYVILKDKEVIEIAGYSIQCIATPGHTPGSMSYLFGAEYLFVGDTMSLQNGKADLFNAYFNMDNDAQAKSLAKLATVQAEYIFTGHYGYSDDSVFAFNDWR